MATPYDFHHAFVYTECKYKQKGIIIRSNPIISPFWYRRICEVTLLVSLIIVGLWGAGTLLNGSPIDSSMLIPDIAAIAAGATAFISTIAYFFVPKSKVFLAALLSYLFLVATAFMVVYSTGHLSSPFIALWMLVSVFAGIFGVYALVPMTILVSGYCFYALSQQLIIQPQLMMFSLVFGLPIVVSYLIWHQKKTHENEKDRVMNALAQELNQVANKAEIVINAIGDGVVAVDNSGVIQLINPAAQSIIGWGKQDALSLDYRSVLKIENEKGEVVGDDKDPIQQCLRTNQSVVCDDLLLETSSGKKLLASILVSPAGASGSGAIIVFRDITQSKAEEREQAEFISTASHEMRTPVAAIEGYLGLALNPQTAVIDDKARMYLEKAHESAQHLGRLFQDLLDVSKAEDGRLKNTPTVVDAVSFVRDLATAFETQAKEKNILIVFKPDTTSIHSNRILPQLFTMVDRDHYREIVSNLIENAIKYTKVGDVTIDVTADDDRVTVSIKDTGIGIPAEDIPHLFQKFYRVDNTDTREIGGTGLGLYLSRRLTEAMSGRIWVKSEYGNGSTFHLETPRVSTEEATKFIESVEASVENPAFPVPNGSPASRRPLPVAAEEATPPAAQADPPASDTKPSST